MQKIQTFFRTLWLSISSPEYYSDILKAPFSFSFKYLVVFNVLLSLITAGMIMIPLTAFNAQSALEQVKQEVPSDVVINVADGQLSINKPLPYAIPERGLSNTPLSDISSEINYVVVFESDENIKGAADVLDQQAIVVVTETTAYVRSDENNKLETYSFSEMQGQEPVSVSSREVLGFIDQIKNHPFIAQRLYIPLIGAILFLIVMPFSIIGAIIVAGFYGFFVWIMGRFFSTQLLAGAEFSYKKAVQVTIHSSTLTIIVQQILNLVMPSHPFTGLVYSLVFFIWTGYVLYQAHHDEVVTESDIDADSKKKTGKVKVIPEPDVKTLEKIEDPV